MDPFNFEKLADKYTELFESARISKLNDLEKKMDSLIAKIPDNEIKNYINLMNKIKGQLDPNNPLLKKIETYTVSLIIKSKTVENSPKKSDAALAEGLQRMPKELKGELQGKFLHYEEKSLEIKDVINSDQGPQEIAHLINRGIIKYDSDSLLELLNNEKTKGCAPFIEKLSLRNPSKDQLENILKQCPNVTNLSIEFPQKLDDVSFVAYCPNLQRFRCEVAMIEDFSHLGLCPNLIWLDIDNNMAAVNDISFLQKLPKLESLRITQCKLLNEDLNHIIACKKLKTLSISHNLFSDITPLSQLSELLRLDISKNHLADIPQRENFPSIKDDADFVVKIPIWSQLP